MNTATKRKLTSRTGLILTVGNACWETAPAIATQLSADFGPFDVDLTADPERHICPSWLGPGSVLDQDALTADWLSHGTTGYSNPPYGPFVQRMLAKAKAEAERGFTSTLLLPLRVTKAFRRYVCGFDQLSGASELIFLDKRLVFFERGVPRCSFDKRGRIRADTAVFDSVIVRFLTDARARPVVGDWKVPPHVFPEDLERARVRMEALQRAA